MNQEADQAVKQAAGQATSQATQEQPVRETHGRYDPRLAGDIAYRMSRHGSMSTGDMAELRRLDPSRPTAEPFWRLMLRHGITAQENDEPERPALETTWAWIIRAIAVDTKVGEKETEGPHRGTANLGRALAENGYREMRLKVLLNAQDETLLKAVENAAHFLTDRGQKFNWNQCAALMMTRHRSEEDRDRDRTRIARDYYRAAPVQEREDG